MQKSLAVDVAIVHRVADIFQDRGKPRRARAAEDGANDENPVVGVEIWRHFLELFRILELVQDHAADVGIAHKTDVHLHIQQVHLFVALVDGFARKQNIGQCPVRLAELSEVDIILELRVGDFLQIEGKTPRKAVLRCDQLVERGDACPEKPAVRTHPLGDGLVVFQHPRGALQVLVGLVRVDDNGDDFEFCRGIWFDASGQEHG